MKKFARILGLLFLRGLLLGGLVLGGSVQTTGWAAEAVGSTACPINVTDGAGRSICLVKPPERIACLYAFSGHVVTMLGRGDNIVSVVRGLKKDKLLHQVLPKVRDLPVPAAGGIIHIESLLKTRPDLVFLKPETARIPSEIDKLERFHLPYFVVDYTSMDEQMEIIEKMGTALGCREKAEAYTRFYRKTVGDVQMRAQAIPDAQKVRLYHAINEPLRTDARGTLEADWTRACGVINVSISSALNTQNSKRFAGMEQVLEWDPQVILANEAGVDRFIRSDPKWAPVRAVLDNRVYLIPVGISRWGHPGGLETPLAVMWTAKTVYPEYFGELDMKAQVQLFYRRFFDLDLDEKTTDRILSGRGMREKH